jgi:hypothetical protein
MLRYTERRRESAPTDAFERIQRLEQVDQEIEVLEAVFKERREILQMERRRLEPPMDERMRVTGSNSRFDLRRRCGSPRGGGRRGGCGAGPLPDPNPNKENPIREPRLRCVTYPKGARCSRDCVRCSTAGSSVASDRTHSRGADGLSLGLGTRSSWVPV